MKFSRYAIYYAPPPRAAWTRFATSWLGWDMQAGCRVEQPAIPDLTMSEVTKAPRRYGLHGTLKPPFRLADGISGTDLELCCADLCRNLSPLSLGSLDLTRMGRFLALCPTPSPGLSGLAADCVRQLDHLRAPLTPEETDRRRKARLSPRQDTNLAEWGYPHVLEDFRFHITLTGRLTDPDLETAQLVLTQKLVPLIPSNTVITDLALTGQDQQGQFHLLRRFALSTV